MGAESDVAAFLIHVQAGAANLAIFGVDLPVLGHTPVANGVSVGARPVSDAYRFYFEHLMTPLIYFLSAGLCVFWVGGDIFFLPLFPLATKLLVNSVFGVGSLVLAFLFFRGLFML